MASAEQILGHKWSCDPVGAPCPNSIWSAQKRVELAGLWQSNSKLLLLDEPAAVSTTKKSTNVPTSYCEFDELGLSTLFS